MAGEGSDRPKTPRRRSPGSTGSRLCRWSAASQPTSRRWRRHVPSTHWSLDLAECLAQPGIEAAILATPTPLHAVAGRPGARGQASTCLVEIPMAQSLAEAEARVVAAADASGLIAMVCHTRRFNPSHQWVHQRIARRRADTSSTWWWRRSSSGARTRTPSASPRSWTDHLLWHHACHTVDLFQYQTGELPDRVQALQGPPHPELGIAMDMSIGMKVPGSGALCSLVLSFNNDGPLGTIFRYICDNGTYVARYDDLVDGYDNLLDVSEVDGVDRRHRAPGPRVLRRRGRGSGAQRLGASGRRRHAHARPAGAQPLTGRHHLMTPRPSATSPSEGARQERVRVRPGRRQPDGRQPDRRQRLRRGHEVGGAGAGTVALGEPAVGELLEHGVEQAAAATATSTPGGAPAASMPRRTRLTRRARSARRAAAQVGVERRRLVPHLPQLQVLHVVGEVPEDLRADALGEVGALQPRAVPRDSMACWVRASRIWWRLPKYS